MHELTSWALQYIAILIDTGTQHGSDSLSQGCQIRLIIGRTIIDVERGSARERGDELNLLTEDAARGGENRIIDKGSDMRREEAVAEQGQGYSGRCGVA